MSERTKWGFVGFSVGAVAGFAFSKLGTLFAERPPIIVRGGSISFETNVGWRQDGNEWDQNFDDYFRMYEVDLFVVKITKDGENFTEWKRGKRVQFDHGGKNFHLSIKNNEPRLGPYGLLKKLEHAGWRVRHVSQKGTITIRIQSDTYNLQEDEEAWIDYVFLEKGEGQEEGFTTV